MMRIFPQGMHSNNQTCTLSMPYTCIQPQVEAVDYGDYANLELYYLIKSHCLNTFSISSARHFQTFKLLCSLKDKLIEKNQAILFKNKC